MCRAAFYCRIIAHYVVVGLSPARDAPGPGPALWPLPCRAQPRPRPGQLGPGVSQGSYGSLKSMKVQDILAVKIMYLKVLNFQETVEKSIKVHIKRVLLLINNYVCYFAGASFEAIVCKKIFCGGKSHSCRRRPIILPASRSFPANRSIG